MDLGRAHLYLPRSLDGLPVLHCNRQNSRVLSAEVVLYRLILLGIVTSLLCNLFQPLLRLYVLPSGLLLISGECRDVF